MHGVEARRGDGYGVLGGGYAGNDIGALCVCRCVEGRAVCLLGGNAGSGDEAALYVGDHATNTCLLGERWGAGKQDCCQKRAKENAMSQLHIWKYLMEWC